MSVRNYDMSNTILKFSVGQFYVNTQEVRLLTNVQSFQSDFSCPRWGNGGSYVYHPYSTHERLIKEF